MECGWPFEERQPATIDGQPPAARESTDKMRKEGIRPGFVQFRLPGFRHRVWNLIGLALCAY